MRGRRLLSIIIGLIVGWFIGVHVKHRHQRVIKGPSSNRIKRHVYHDTETGKYYRFEPYVTVCPPSVDVTVLEHSDDSASDE